MRLEKQLAGSEERPDDFGSLIVNPSTLKQEQSLLVCSRCHGKMITKQQYDRQCLTDGDFFESGDWDYADRYDHPTLDLSTKFDESWQGKLFWKDGTPRTTALEYQGLLMSPCCEAGELTCLSCHSMHHSDPNDQLRFGDSLQLPVVQQNLACTQCHDNYKSDEQLQRHTRHAPQTPGSLCYNCHMPWQAYSLLNRVRSRRISNPSAAVTDEFGIPNACNQCHVDKTLEWTQKSLALWKGPTTDPSQRITATCH